MRYFHFIFFILFSFNTKALELNIGSLNYTIIPNNWEKITLLPDFAVFLQKKDDAFIIKNWRAYELYQDNEIFIDNFKKDKLIYSAKNFIDCITKVECKTKDLEQYIASLPAYGVIPKNPQNICTNKNLSCFIFPSVIPGYKYEAFIYNTKSQGNEFIRISSANANKSLLKKFINNFNIKGV